MCENSVLLKKPFIIDKSDPELFIVKCLHKTCPFKMSFQGTPDGVFILIEERQHVSDSLLPTIKRSWLREKIIDLLEDNGKLKVTQLIDILRENNRHHDLENCYQERPLCCDDVLCY